MTEKILVTGGAGFLGSHVVDCLASRGYDVIVPRKRDYDLRVADDIRRLLQAHQPSHVIHLAASVGGIGANMKQPGTFFYDNALMGIQLMHHCMLHGVEKMIIAGTICAYPKYCPSPFCEHDIWNGYPEETNAPYGLAKKMLLVQSSAYRDEFGFNSCVLFPTNLYGERDCLDVESNHVIPAMIRKMIEAKRSNADSIDLWGDGTATREFLYVGDAARAFVNALELHDSSEPINIGSGVEISIRDLAQIIAKIVGYEGAILWDVSKPNGQPRRLVDSSSALRELKWSAEVSLEEGLKRTVKDIEARL